MDLRKLNSLTKYPSILTYHAMGERGKLTESLSEDKGFGEEDLFVYEKIDGENSRIVFLNSGYESDYFIGSREELLFAKGDRIGNPYGDIAKLLSPIGEDLDWLFRNDRGKKLTVIYMESYGGKTKSSKNYTTNKAQSYRVFDIFSLNHSEFVHLMNLPIEKIAEWRDYGGQPFYGETEKQDFVNKWSLQAAPLLTKINGKDFPEDREKTFEYLKNFKETKVGIDTNGKSEGIIVRNGNRKMIRKIRFEDYERTFRK